MSLQNMMKGLDDYLDLDEKIGRIEQVKLLTESEIE